MRLYYDGFIYGMYHQRTGGISRYFDDLISHLPADLQILLTSSRSPHLPHPHHPGLRIEYANPRRFPWRFWGQVEHYRYLLSASLFHPDLIHPTYYFPPRIFSNQRRRRPLVYTVYDMIHEIFADMEDPQGRAAAAKIACLDQADLLLCISESTRQDLVRFYPHLEARARVVHLGCSHGSSGTSRLQKSMTVPLPAALSSVPYLLYVGSRNYYKNFSLLVRALSKLLPTNPDLHLCVVGSRLSEQEWRMVAELGLNQRLVQVESPGDSLLRSLYAGAQMFVYPSLYEGFGIPPLEAMQCGTPVVASNTSSIPEVVGDAACLFDPHNLDELVDSIRFLLGSASLRDEYVRRGHQRTQQFNWSITASQTMDHYRSLM